MLDYSTVPNTAGAFPNVVALNATGPGATDGTPFIKQMIDDLWGARQALMDAAGLSPNAVQEAAGASQNLEALRNVVGSPGEVIAWHGNTSDPSSVNIRMLPLNGQGILRASYPELDAAVYVGDPSNPTAPAYYHADDAAGTLRNTAGIYLIFPDLRGYVLRGLDPTGTIDPLGASRTLADTQAFALQEHKHTQIKTGTTVLYYTTTDLTAGGVTIEHISSTPGLPIDTNTTISGAPSSPNETRMINVSVRWCIRY